MKSNSWMNAVVWFLVGILWIPGNIYSANLIRWWESTGSRVENADQGFRFDPASLLSWQREEGEPVVIRVLRADDRLQSMSVGFRTVQGTAKAGEDLVPVQGRLNFGPMERVQPIIIPLIDDRTRENQEIFQVELFDPEGGSLGELVSATISIAPNDEPPDFFFGPRAIESEAMGQVFVSLLEPAEYELRYRVVVEAFDGLGGAIPGSDPRMADFQPIDHVVVIPSGRKQAIAHFPVFTQNRDRTATQRKLVARVEPLAGSGGWTHDPVEFEIADEANEFELIPPFDLPLYSGIPEGAGTVEYRLRRHGGTLQPAVVAYEIRAFDSADSAQPNLDFVASQGTLRFEFGETEKRIPVTVIDRIDKKQVNGRSFELSLQLTEGEGSLGHIGSSDHPKRASVGLRIADVESRPLPPSQSPFPLESPFGSQLIEMEGKAEFVLRRQGSLETPVVCLVDVQPFDSFSQFEYNYGYRPATPGLDFEVSTVRLEFAAGQSEATFSVELHADLEVERTEVFDLNFTWMEPSGASNRVRQIMSLLDATSLPMRVQPLTRAELGTIDLSVDERAFPDGSRLYTEPMAGFGEQTAIFRADLSGAGVSGFEPVRHNRGVGEQVGNAPHGDVTLAAQGDRFWMMYPTLELVPTFRLQRFSAMGQPDANIGPMQLTTLTTFAYSPLWKSELWSPLRLIPEASNSMVLLGSTRWVNGRLTPYGARVIAIPQELDVASQSATVSEADGARSLVILRFGDIRQPASYRWRVTDGTAKSGRDYVPGSGLLEFGAGQSLARIPLVLIDNATADWDRALVLRFERADSGRLAAEVDIVVANDDPGILDISPAQGDPTKIRLVVTGPLKPRSYERDVNILASNDLVHWTPIAAEAYPPLGFYPEDPGVRVPMEHHLQYFRVHAVRR
jgi:hypothetical protein